MLARVASHHFAPTIAARDALLAEGVAPGIITVTGNTVVDTIAERLGRFPKAKERDTVLVTCHRRENHTESLSDICAAIARLCALYPRLSFVFPVHYNAAVRGPVLKALSGIANLSLIDPLDYDENLKALGRSRLVITDSGGLQEEAPSFGVPVVVMRDHTERQEGIDAGFATLAGRRRDDIVEAARSWLDHPERTAALANRPNPYGDGRASQRIVAVLHGRTPEPMT